MRDTKTDEDLHSGGVVEWDMSSVVVILMNDFQNRDDSKSEETDNEYMYVYKYRWLPLHSDSYTEPVGRSNGTATPNTGVQNPTWTGMSWLFHSVEVGQRCSAHLTDKHSRGW